MSNPLTAAELNRIDAYWRAANYSSVGQTYLFDHPLPTEPLQKERIKLRLLAHWGTNHTRFEFRRCTFASGGGRS